MNNNSNVPANILERCYDEMSIIANGVRYCGKRLQTDGIELYVITGDYEPAVKTHMTYIAAIHRPSKKIEWFDMLENGKLFPWITKKVAKGIEEFKLSIKKG